MGVETLLITSMALTAVGTGASAYSSYESGKATERLHEYNAKVSENDALRREMEAQAQAAGQRESSERILEKQRALYAKGGVLDEGTPLTLLADTAAELELAALEIERGGNVEASRSRQQAVIDRMAGKSAARAGKLGAGATLLQGAGSIAGSFAYGKHTGMIGKPKPIE